MSYPIEKIEGIGPVLGAKLNDAGITNTGKLLEACASTKGRQATSERTGIDARQLLKWANMADMMRISGVGEEFSELLEAAGVDTVKELRTRNAENLTAKMTEVNETRKLCRRAPTGKDVEKWVAAAKTLDPMITH